MTLLGPMQLVPSRLTQTTLLQKDDSSRCKPRRSKSRKSSMGDGEQQQLMSCRRLSTRARSFNASCLFRKKEGDFKSPSSSEEFSRVEVDALELLIHKAKAMLQNIHKAVTTHETQVQEVGDTVAHQWDLARARLGNRNERAAVWSMKKVKQLQLQQEKLHAVIDYLEMQVIELVAWITKAEGAAVSSEQLSLRRRASLTLELDKFNGIGHNVQTMLSSDVEDDNNSTKTMSEKELLEELEAATEASSSSFPAAA